jgi:DNA-binding MarR family transcriptional regulator
MSNCIFDNDLNLNLSTLEVMTFAYLLSIYREHDGVCVSQKIIAQSVNLCVSTTRKCINNLSKKDLILEVFEGEKKQNQRFAGASIYVLPSKSWIDTSGYFLVPRKIFEYRLTPKEFAVYLFLWRAEDSKIGLLWNSYNDFLKKFGLYFKLTRSEIIKIIKKLTELKLIKKTVRKAKTVHKKFSFIDNIYRFG